MSGEAGGGAAGETSSAADLGTLIPALEDPDALVRGSAVIALLREDPEHVLAVLAARRKERESTAPGDTPYPGPRILEYQLIARASMTPSIRERFEPTDHPICAAALAEPNAFVRSRAMSACVRVGTPDREWLKTAIRDTSWVARTRLADALSSQAGTDPASAEALRLLADDQHETVRQAARRALF